MKQEKREKKSIWRRLGAPDLLADSQVEIVGRGRVLLRGAEKILSYGEDRILVKVGREKLAVEGEKLYCVSFHRGALLVRGKIGGVHFEGGAK